MTVPQRITAGTRRHPVYPSSSYPSPPPSLTSKIFKRTRTLNEAERRSASDMTCQECGKTYKHTSRLSKHRWEHSPHWSQTSTLKISKHQQVQLLEAATILIDIKRKPSSASPPPFADPAMSRERSRPGTARPFDDTSDNGLDAEFDSNSADGEPKLTPSSGSPRDDVFELDR